MLQIFREERIIAMPELTVAFIVIAIVIAIGAIRLFPLALDAA